MSGAGRRVDPDLTMSVYGEATILPTISVDTETPFGCTVVWRKCHRNPGEIGYSPRLLGTVRINFAISDAKRRTPSHMYTHTSRFILNRYIHPPFYGDGYAHIHRNFLKRSIYTNASYSSLDSSWSRTHRYAVEFKKRLEPAAHRLAQLSRITISRIFYITILSIAATYIPSDTVTVRPL